MALNRSVPTDQHVTPPFILHTRPHHLDILRNDLPRHHGEHHTMIVCSTSLVVRCGLREFAPAHIRHDTLTVFRFPAF